MERFIFFPKDEFHYFNEAKKYFKNLQYKKAVELFEKANKLKYLKSDCIKYLIDCHIKLHNYDEVYKMIEDEFVAKNVDEEYLLKKYLYTMVLDEQYIEAGEIIRIYIQNNVISDDLKAYLNELLFIVDKHLNTLNDNSFDEMKKNLTSSKFEDHIQIILNLEKLDYDLFQREIKTFLNNPNFDSFVKYSLLKYLFDNNIVDEIEYTNYFREKKKINKEHFIDLLNDERFNEPIQRVLKNIEHEYPQTSEFIKNIWLDYSIKHYPNFIGTIDISSCILHIILLQSMQIEFNINDVCKLYQVNTKSIFKYFEC